MCSRETWIHGSDSPWLVCPLHEWGVLLQVIELIQSRKGGAEASQQQEDQRAGSPWCLVEGTQPILTVDWPRWPIRLIGCKGLQDWKSKALTDHLHWEYPTSRTQTANSRVRYCERCSRSAGTGPPPALNRCRESTDKLTASESGSSAHVPAWGSQLLGR